MTRIFLIRHCECEGNVINALTGRTDFNLTENGKKIAEKLLIEMKKYKIDTIYASPSRRCIDTVFPIAKYFNLKININDDLLEKYFGIYDGCTWDEVEKENPQIVEYKRKFGKIEGIPKQETTQEVELRMDRCMREIAEANRDKTILICSHGCSILIFLKKNNAILYKEQKDKFSQKNGAINILEYKNSEFKIIELNQTDYLEL